MSPEEIEAQYQQSAYVKEICVLGHCAVVVPDLALMRQRRIVNIGDLLRFEIEGQSIHLPQPNRVLEYEVWFDPLPRTTAGEVQRHEVERRVQERRQRAASVASSPPQFEWWGDDSHAAA